MIASLRGQVRHIGLDSCVLETGGVGYRVHATPGTLATLRTGAETELATSMVVREDSMTLYGFAEPGERDIFERLQTVSGVGPRLALAMLAVHTPDGLRSALATEDVKALTKVPGIGEKGARRIIVDLGDKLGPPHSGAAPAQTAITGSRSRAQEDVAAALEGLGWPAKAAAKTVDQVFAEDSGLDTAAALRLALQRLGGAGNG